VPDELPGSAPVEGAEVLYRRVTAKQADPATGAAYSAAFLSRHEDGVSTCPASLMTPEQVLAEGKPGMGLVSVLASEARAAGAEVCRDPTNPKHVLLRLPGGIKAQRKIAKKIAVASCPVEGHRPFNVEGEASAVDEDESAAE
jgi:hypothetical protein